MKLISCNILASVGGRSILALLAIFAVIMMCTLPSAHAKVADVESTLTAESRPIKAERRCVQDLEGNFEYPVGRNTKEAKCNNITNDKAYTAYCQAMCEGKDREPGWMYDKFEKGTCYCKYEP